MGRIKKVATERHTATASPFISEFVKEATSIPLHQLPKKLDSFPQQWPFPRGDLYHWIPLLDRFDHILDLFNKEYQLEKGPQKEAFERRLLQGGDSEDGMPYPSTGAQSEELDALDYSSEGDREVVEALVHFTRILLEHCGNRSLYSSSGHIGTLFNTTSLSLLRLALRLGLRLAQRFQVARYKNNHPQALPILLASHYNINLDTVQKIAQPFPKASSATTGAVAVSVKGKEKAGQTAIYNPTDLVAIAKDPVATAAKADLASVNLTYYEPSSTSRPGSAHQANEATPITPTPVRRTSALGPSRDRPSMGERSATTGDMSLTPVKSREGDANSSSAPKTFQISSTKVAETPAWALVSEALEKVPAESAYDALNRIRIAKAFVTPQESSQELLEIRLLAIANLAYVLGESKFQEKIGIPDNEEPKRFHLAQQLCDLLQPPTNGQIALSLEAETVVLLTIEALSKIRHKSAEVSDALQISQNHGVLYYELRKVIATLNVDEHLDSKLEIQETEWREATFDLTNTLLQSNTQARHGDRMVQAGIMGVLVEALNLHTNRAERFQEKILQFFDSFIHGISTAFQTLASVKGLDILADLLSYEVTSSLQNAKDGKGLPAEFKSKVVDYDIPFHKQSTLRQLCKFITHLFDHNAGTHDRLLRNLIDTPQVLGALRNVIENANVFGSNVWSGAVNIMSGFIHNEPTSFQVVAEAGLVKSLLQTIVPWDVTEAEEDPKKFECIPTALEYKDGELQYPTASGILPVGETMCDIPTAFGAICLNEQGMKLFQSSRALLKFMDIFVSPPHVRALEEEGQTAASIGQAFDELSRHHPQLKDEILTTVVAMVKRVGQVCRYLAESKGTGSKLWQRSPTGLDVSGGRTALAGPLRTSVDPNETVTVADLNEDEKDRVPAVPFISACFKFFEGFFHNSSMCSLFCERGGAIYLLDLATSASNPYDMVAFPVFSKIAQVIKSMCEAKPHLVLPTLIHRTRIAIAGLKPLVESKHPEGLFATFTDLSKPQISLLPAGADGTTISKSLSMMHMLTHVLGRALSPPQYTGRHAQPSNQIFVSLNFTDVYIELVDSLGQLHAACVWESLALQNTIPEKWKQQTEPRPFMMRRVDPVSGIVDLADQSRTESLQTNGEAGDGSNASDHDENEEKFAIKNSKTIRYLLSQSLMGIEAFFHSLGQALVPKRNVDIITKQHAALVSEHVAQALVREFSYHKFDDADELTVSKARSQAVLLCTRTLLKSSHSVESWGAKEALTLVLNKFYLAGGFDQLNDCLRHFGEVLVKQPQKGDALNQCARDTLSNILTFYNQVVRSKTINESPQSSAISVRSHEQADYFMPGQFVVEVRDAILPAVSELWHSAALEALGDSHVKTVIETLRTILKGEGEERAIHRSEKASRRVQINKPEFKLRTTEGLRSLTSSGYEEPLAREALYRCNNQEPYAQSYCHLRLHYDTPSFPIPSGETQTAAETAPQAESDSLHRQSSIEMTDAAADGEEFPSLPEDTRSSTPASIDPEIMSDDERFRIPADLQNQDLIDMVGGADRLRNILNMTNGSDESPKGPTSNAFTTVEDLDDKRQTLRDKLLDRCLEVLSAQTNITFELSELIQAAVSKTGEGASPRADIGSTLVSSLISLQGEEPSPESGAKIAAYAHLVGLIIQDRDFFDSTLDELKDYFDALVGWIQLDADQKAEDAPWINMILLIIERILVEDEQPVEVPWKTPSSEDPLKALPEPIVPEPVVSTELRTSLFDAVVDLLPKVGKNTSLALSVSRILVMLTRRRNLAMRLSDKHTMSRLFLMVRQLGGSVNDKFRSSFMIILRHMVEDEHILRQIMQTEIRAAFENHRSARAMDTTTYTRNLFHLVLRDPELFVKLTGDLVEIPRYETSPSRGQVLALKKEAPQLPSNVDNKEKPDGDAPDVQSSIEGDGAAAPKSDEVKPPTVEVTDGVVQFLLRELSNYKDVKDEQAQPLKDANSTSSPDTNGTSEDVTMSEATTSDSAPSTSGSNTGDKSTTFKPEEHVIYIYRCFLMQCLSELLASYHRTKVEFINFSRKPEPATSTPSKPRSGTLNYLLNTLIPIGTLEHRDDIAHRKKLSTSHWATSVLVALVSKTTERQTPRAMARLYGEGDDSDLSFVRKFTLEHALRAFRDAMSSQEPLDQRYSRLLALGELFNRMLSTKSNSSMSGGADTETSRQIGKLMYEKNFVSALTSAIAELDLNFPNAKRVVKYILGPLKLLTELGVALSQYSDLSSSAAGNTDEDDISSATSISDEDEDEEREQTPDLYRNSTLGLFEARGDHGDESESESDEDEDEGMYDEEYDEEEVMDYEHGPIPDHDEVVSDEDEDDEESMGEMEGVPGDFEVEMDVVMNPDEEELTDSESSEDDEDEDGEDQDPDFLDHMEEITGDDENASIDDHRLDTDWDGQPVGVNLDDMFDEDHIEEGGSPHGGPLGQMGDVLDDAGISEPGGVVRIDMGDGDEEYFEDEMPPEDDDEDVDEELDYENEVVYEPEVEGPLNHLRGVLADLNRLADWNRARRNVDDDDDDEDDQDMRWDMGVPPPAQIIRGHHHHHHHRHGLQDMFGMVGGDGFRMPAFRTHRPTANMRAEEEGINPLLQRDGNFGASGRERDPGQDVAISTANRLIRGVGRAVLPRPGDAIIQDLVATLGPNGGQTINVNFGDGSQMVGVPAPPMFTIQGRHGGHALIDIDPNRPWRDHGGLPRWPDLIAPPRPHDSRSPNSEEAQAVESRTIQTTVRWQEEARMLFGGKHHDKAMRVMNSLSRILIPPAMEAKRLQELAEAERKAAEEKTKQEERARREAEKAQREEQEKKEREEREAKEAEEARAREEAMAQETTTTETEAGQAGDSTMEGVEQSQPADSSQVPQTEAAATEAPAEPMYTTIRGRQLDITSLGIDQDYLDALPEEFREEVIMQAFAEQRTQGASTGEQTSSEINREFLEALPPDIQQELLRQEAIDRQRREQEEARRRNAQEGNAQPAQAEDMNNADFLAMLDPGLRQTVLMDADENILATLPEHLQAEARTLLGERRLPRPDLGRLGRLADGEARILERHRGEHVARDGSRQRRPAVQMLDKAGIATLLRLMFVSLHHKAKTNLHSILSDVCKNTQNRAEVISILLSILQDGTADVAAVERSFAHLSLRAKQVTGSKAPTPLKRTATGTIVSPGAELSPLNIVQQCLGTLNALTLDNSRVPSFFLTEHETLTSQKVKASKKGKEKESKAAKYPLNSLLSLLDRKLITENTGVMEALASLLSRVTTPLTIILKKAKEAEDAEKAKAEQSAREQQEPAASRGDDVQMAEAATTAVEQVETTDVEVLSEDHATEPTTAEGAPEPLAVDVEASKTDEKKKQPPVLPDVPHENIRLVVNIITARECPSKTFTETLDVLKNLSAIPGAKEVFGKELVRQAQELSEAVLVDLEELAKQINLAETGTDIQGMALANFSSTASTQHKLLRVIIALDHLFDPKHTLSLPEALSASEPKLKDDILAGLYDGSTFDKLWSNLSQCLAAIRKKGNLVNVAAILLPMIESLLVVCRNSTLKEAMPDPTSPQVGTPPPENRLDSLFFKFTEEHRKILNELIRSNPKLMNGNLAILAKNSKVLEFDNKRVYFTRKVHARPPQETRVPSLQLSVRRDQVFLDSFKSLYYKSGKEIKYGKLNIRFHGEEGIDAGGVSREWFAAMARQMFNPDYALFNPVASDRTTFHPNNLSVINPEHLMFFKFIGRIIGKALYEGRVLDCHFSRAVYRRILGKSVSLKDMESLDLDYYKSLVWILENDITDITFETFSVDIDKFGEMETVDLIPGGRDIAVTEENKHDYVRLVVEHRLIKSVEEQLENFLTGFHDIIPPELIAIFNEQELELLISGLPEIDVDDWKNNTEYHNYQAVSPQIQWFWRAVRSFDKEEKAKLLQFVTGTSKVPLNGFKELEGMNGFAKFNVHRDYSSSQKLPSSHTCFNQLDLPEYESYEQLRQQLYTAITAGSEYFGFA